MEPLCSEKVPPCHFVILLTNPCSFCPHRLSNCSIKRRVNKLPLLITTLFDFHNRQPQLPAGWQLLAGYQHAIKLLEEVHVPKSSCIFLLNDL